MKSSLYITYDGLSDQLGGSQIIPYIKYLARHGHKITVMSCEKTKYLTDETHKSIEADLGSVGIQWHYVTYTKSPPILSGLYDRWNMTRLARSLFKTTHFDIIHCRSYLPALIGMTLKQYFQKTKAKTPKLLFDMRGFWADEKVEVGAWPQNKFHYKYVYNYFKKAEADLIAASDHIVSLTSAGETELRRWPAYSDLPSPPPITVIPCCVDTDHFEIVTSAQKRSAKERLGFSPQTPILGYLGAIGGWYMLEEMLIFFAGIKQSQPEAKMFFITRSDPDLILGTLSKFGLQSSDVLIRPAKRHEVPGFLAAMDIGLSFIKPTYAKTASSPTKQAEYLACGIPIVTNDKIGDNLTLIGPVPGCHVLSDLETNTLTDYAKTVTLMPKDFSQDDQDARAAAIRDYAVSLFSLNVGGARYKAIYEVL